MRRIIGTLLILSIAFAACAQDKETRTLEPFDEISVGESIQVYLTKGNGHKARIETTNVSTDKVLTQNSNGELRIQMARGSFHMTKVKVYLNFQELRKIDVSSSADVYCEDRITGSSLSVDISSSGFADINVDVDELEVDISSSGKLQVNGSANYAEMEVSSSGRLMAFDLKTDVVQIQANSSGKAEINVIKELRAEANSSGRVAYSGSPEKIFVDSNSGGRVNSVN